jgi:hypothetical protein
MDVKREHLGQIEHTPPQTMSTSSSSEKADTFDQSNHVENITNQTLTSEHRDYLIERHGTVDLEPMPSMDPVDPLNWPSWKVFFFPILCI